MQDERITLSPRAHRAIAALKPIADLPGGWRAVSARGLILKLRAGQDVLTAADELLGYSTASRES